MNILEMIAVIIIAVLLIIAIVLYLGIRLKGSWEKKGRELEVNLDILLLSRFKVYSISYPSGDEKAESDEKEEENGFDAKNHLKDFKAVFHPFLDFFKSFLNAVEVKILQNHLDFGLDSYADTAKYVGYMWSVLVIPNSMFENASLSVSPNFNESKIDFKGHADIKINLAKLVVPAARLVSDKNTINLIKKIRSGQNA